MIRTIDKSLQPLKRRIYLMLGRAVLAALSDDKQRQYVQFSALKGEVKDNVERVQEYGFTSHPLPGAQVIFISLSGNRDQSVLCGFISDVKLSNSITAGPRINSANNTLPHSSSFFGKDDGALCLSDAKAEIISHKYDFPELI